MLIQDMNHIEVAQTEVVGGNAAARRIGFSTTNTFNTNIRNNVNLGGAASATAGAAADAISNISLLTFSKADSSAFVRDGASSSISTSAAAIQYH